MSTGAWRAEAWDNDPSVMRGTETSFFLEALQHLQLRPDVTAWPGTPWMIYNSASRTWITWRLIKNVDSGSVCLKCPWCLHRHQFPGDANAADPQTTLWGARAWETQSHIHTDIQSCSLCIYTYGHTQVQRKTVTHSFRNILSVLFFLGQSLYTYRHTRGEHVLGLIFANSP